MSASDGKADVSRVLPRVRSKLAYFSILRYSPPQTKGTECAGVRSQQSEVAQFAAHRLGHRGHALLGDPAEIGRCGIRIEIAPALERPHRPRRHRDHLRLHDDAAAA